MKTKKVVLINDTVEYSISVKETGSNTLYKMKRSDADCWADSVKGEKVAKLVDNGNEVEFNIDNAIVILDYSQLWELHVLLSAFYSSPLDNKFLILNVQE